MVVLVKLIGVIILAMGAVYLVRPVFMKQAMYFWIKGKMCYIAGVVNVAIGILLLIAASACSFTRFIDIIAILSLVKGIVLFVLGPQRVAVMSNHLIKGSTLSLRISSFIILVVGALLIYSA